MMKTLIITGLLALTYCISGAQSQKPDTVIINLTNSSRVVFTIEDRNDLETLKNYNFQQLFDDIIAKIENGDTTALVKEQEPDEPSVANNESLSLKEEDHETNDNEEDEDDDDIHWHHTHKGWGRTWQSFNFDLGTNNYLMNGKFPDSENQLYSVRPWGSWYFAMNSTQRTRIARKFFLEWALGVSWYNFKFQNDNIVIQKESDGVVFLQDDRGFNYQKSKLSVTYLNASLIPVFDFSDNNWKPNAWEGKHNSFRIGLGPYVGYRIGSHSKLVYRDGGREKEKERDNFYLENLRYGMRLQVGFRSTDLFFNYDLNHLFTENKGPKLNAFSFGVVF